MIATSLNTVVDTIVHLDQCKLTLYRGTYDQFERQRQEKQALAEKMRRKQDEQRKHMQAFVDRVPLQGLQGAAGPEPPEGAGQVAADLGDRRRLDGSLPVSLAGKTARLADRAARRRSCGICGDPVLKGLNLRLDHDDRIGLLGANGNGKSTLAKLLSARLEACGGRFMAAEKMKVGFFAPATSSTS